MTARGKSQTYAEYRNLGKATYILLYLIWMQRLPHPEHYPELQLLRVVEAGEDVALDSEN